MTHAARRELRSIVRRELSRHPRLALQVLLLGILQSALALLMPWFAGEFTRMLLGQPGMGGTLGAWFAIVLAQAGASYILILRNQALASRMVASLQSELFAALLRLRMAWHWNEQRGDVLSILQVDVPQVVYFLCNTLLPVCGVLLTAIGAVVMILRNDPMIGAIIACTVPAAILVVKLAGRRLRDVAQAARSAQARKWALAEQGLSMLPAIKAYTAESEADAAFRAQADLAGRLEQDEFRMQNAIDPVVRILLAAALLAILVLASRAFDRGNLDPAALVESLFYGVLLSAPLGHLAGSYARTHAAAVSAARIAGILEGRAEQEVHGATIPDSVGTVVFRDVHFSYTEREPLLKGLDLTVRPGEIVAITGINGAGKSTLAHLMLRLIEPQSGAILVNGIDARELPVDWLRRRIALVAQQVLLSNDTVLRNIALGSAGASRERVVHAATLAGADGFIKSLPLGYDTIIGDEGALLSGGQRQRLALARALLRDADVVILDEGTAMLDPEGEAEFVTRGRGLFAGKTVLVITHRPATLVLADRILRLQDGRLHEADFVQGQAVAVARGVG